MTRTSVPRHHLLVVALLTLFAVARGGYWVATLEVWSPVDEAQHFGYVESLATGDGIPTVGRDRLSGDVLAIAKEAPTYFARSRPYAVDEGDERWGAAGAQYEGIQGPTYYALMVPAYWAGHAVGPLAALYAVRLASVLLAAAAVPLAWALARRLLPDRPLAWLLGPGLLVCVNGFMATGATASNDTIVITGSVAALLLATWALDTDRLGPAAITGFVAGAVFVGKTTALGLFPLIGLLALVQHRNGAARTDRWLLRLAAAGAGAAAVALPWIAWNLHAYGAISGAEAAEAITGQLQVPLEPGLDALHRHWEGARLAFWDAGLLTGEASYRRAWDLVVAIVGGAGLIAAIRRWRQGEVLALTALGLSFPISFVAMVGFLFFVLGGSGLLLGRYVYVALVPVVLGLGAAVLALVGRRWAVPAALGLASFLLWQEIDLTDHYLRTAYEERVSDGAVIDADLAPVADQSWNDGLVAAEAVVVNASCPVEVVQVGLQTPPSTLTIAALDTQTTASATQVATVDTGFTTYELADPVSGELRIDVPEGSGVAVSSSEREPAAFLDGDPADPLVRVWCRVDADQAADERFEVMYDPQHPDLTRTQLRAWPRLLFAGAAAATVLAVAATVAALLADRRRPT